MGGNETALVRYRVDAARGRFVVQAFAEGLLSVFGHNPTIAVRGFGGDVRFAPGALERASVLMMVKADSLAVAGGASENDRLEIERVMRAEVLETARYPEIVFVSKAVSARTEAEGRYRVRVVGSLSLHGVERDCPIEAQVTVNGDSLRAQGEFALRQSDYTIKPVSIAGGTLRVKDEVKLSFDMVASKQ